MRLTTTYICILIALTACQRSTTLPATANKAQAVVGRQDLAYRDATPEECASGGGVYSIYLDQNSNGVLDFDELVLHSQTVCNGANGSNGFSTVFSSTSVSTGLSACASASGLQISLGLDGNRSGILDADEISQTQVLCNGLDGAVGLAGPAGAAGLNAVFAITPAAAEVCPTGGSLILMALDSDISGTYSVDDIAQQSMTLCNGTNGSNGQTPAYTPVEPILPCGNTVAYKEVLLRLQNGQVLASFSEDSNGRNTRFAFLPDGTYQDTDGSSCVFSLSTTGTTRAISWFNQVQMSWELY